MHACTHARTRTPRNPTNQTHTLTRTNKRQRPRTSRASGFWGTCTSCSSPPRQQQAGSNGAEPACSWRPSPCWRAQGSARPPASLFVGLWTRDRGRGGDVGVEFWSGPLSRVRERERGGEGFIVLTCRGRTDAHHRQSTIETGMLSSLQPANLRLRRLVFGEDGDGAEGTRHPRYTHRRGGAVGFHSIVRFSRAFLDLVGWGGRFVCPSCAAYLGSLIDGRTGLNRCWACHTFPTASHSYPLLFDPQTAGGLLAAVPKSRAAVSQQRAIS